MDLALKKNNRIILFEFKHNTWGYNKNSVKDLLCGKR